MKSRGHTWLIYILTFVLINALVFLIPFEKTTPVFIAWAGMILVYLLGAFALVKATGKKTGDAFLTGKRTMKSIAVWIIIQAAVLATAAILGAKIPVWAALAAEAVLLVLAAISTIRTDMTHSTVRKMDQDMNAVTADIKGLRAKADALCNMSVDAETKKALKALADELRYTDPVSNQATEQYESRINTLLESIAHHEDPVERMELIRRAAALVKERAAAAKASK